MNSNALDKLIEQSQRIASKGPIWTQGTGGNVSIKVGELLYIKGTGFRLSALSKERGIACVNTSQIVTALQNQEWTKTNREENYNRLIKSSARLSNFPNFPSMETAFHASLTQPLVLHFHALSSLLMSYENKTTPKRLKDSLGAILYEKIQFIPTCAPGYELSQNIFGESKIFILENHGVILQGNEEDILSLWEEIEIRFCKVYELSLLSLANPSTEADWDSEIQQLAIPLKLYFPDSAVFLDRILKILIPNTTTGLFNLKPDAYTLDLDATELWYATQILYKLCPELPELPRSVSSIVATLPSEQLRRSAQAHLCPPQQYNY